MLLQVALAFRGNVINLLPLRIHRADVTLVLQQLERGIHGAG
jgi:hypothetical protein